MAVECVEVPIPPLLMGNASAHAPHVPLPAQDWTPQRFGHRQRLPDSCLDLPLGASA